MATAMGLLLLCDPRHGGGFAFPEEQPHSRVTSGVSAVRTSDVPNGDCTFKTSALAPFHVIPDSHLQMPFLTPKAQATVGCQIWDMNRNCYLVER